MGTNKGKFFPVTTFVTYKHPNSRHTKNCIHVTQIFTPDANLEFTIPCISVSNMLNFGLRD